MRYSYVSLKVLTFVHCSRSQLKKMKTIKEKLISICLFGIICNFSLRFKQ
jgi:hypothetical protein